MRYDVMFTLSGKRDFKEFKRKTDAIKFVRTIKSQGAIRIFLDTYDSDDDLINYKCMFYE